MPFEKKVIFPEKGTEAERGKSFPRNHSWN